MTHARHAEVRALAEKACNETITPEESTRLNELLRGDPDAQVLFTQYMGVHAGLAWELGSYAAPAASAPEVAAAGPPSLRRRRRVWNVAVAGGIAAVLVLAVSLVWQSRRPPAPLADGTGGPPPGRGAFATVTRVYHPQWQDAGGGLAVGRELGAAELRLAAGMVELTFANTAIVLLEGPAELDVVSGSRAFLRRGQAVVFASTPQAHGFTVETKRATVVDLGTEFGVKASAAGGTEVQVFTGKVVTQAKASQAPKYELTAGRAVQIAGTGATQEADYRPERFVRRMPPADQRAGSQTSPYNKSRFSEMNVRRRADRPPTIDGDLADWPADGRFLSRCEAPFDGGYYVEGAMAYDDRFLYIAAHVGDPSPMRNVVSPGTDAELAWRGGGIQVRLSTDRQQGWPVTGDSQVFRRERPETPADTDERRVHLTLWHYAPSKQDCLHIAYGMDFHRTVINPDGYRGAFRRDPDGRGYVAEYAIPLALLGAAGDPPRPGDVLGTAWNVHWSGEDGRLWHGQLVEVVSPRDPDAEANWGRASTWGRAVFE